MPYVAILAFRRKRASVAPVLIAGTTRTPGNISFMSISTAANTSGRSGDGWLSVALFTNDTLICGSANTPIRVSRTDAGDTPGRMRQLTLAVARWGNALLA